jgi:Leucine-rich repeat (LRR) protein
VSLYFKVSSFTKSNYVSFIFLFLETHLRELIVSGNNLRSLPTAIKDLINLEYLDVSKNPLKIRDSNDVNCFPLEMRYLYKLKRLNVSECNLRYIPSPIWLVPSIEHLDLSRNKLGLLVPEIGSLQNLQVLNLSQCDLSTLPPEIGFCVELVEIILWGNQIESLPDTLKECVKLRELKINYRSFLVNQIDTYVEDLIRKGKYTSEHIPPVVFDLVSLTILDLSGAKINALPENHLKNLIELYLGSNFFDKLPERFFQSMIESLKVLKLDGNALDQVPNEIKLLEKLEVLNLDHNKLTAFPGHDEFNLMCLRELYISNNQLTQLTDSIGLLKSLKTLVLDCNRLTDLPESLFDLVDLEYLDLSNNIITKLSNSITKLRNLKCSHSYVKLNKTGLWLIGNPLELPPHKIWKTKNIEKIYNYLTTFYRRDVNYIRYSKLIFIGDSNVGKSIIIDCILNPLNLKKLQQQPITLSSSIGMIKKSETNHRNSVMNRSNNYISTPLDINVATSFAQKMSLNEQYTPLSKSNSRLENQLANAHNNGKESIVPNLYVPISNTDSLTKIARKLYLRTKDKYEFGILDLAGEPTYHSLYPLFISSIDYTNQPTIFVLVYSHSEYTTALHDKYIGNWLKYIISFTNNDSDDKIKVKLVGIQSDLSDLDEEEFDTQIFSIKETKKQNEIIENCYQTINLHKKQLLKEKNRLEDLLKQKTHDEDNVINIEESLKLINKQLSKEIDIINMEPLIIKSDTIQSDLNDLVTELQYETKKFNTFAPISFRDQLKKYVLKFDRNSYKIDLDDFMEKINNHKIDLFFEDDMLISELNDIFNNTERIVDYLATINDIFWFKMNPKYKNFIFHRTGFMLKSLQVVVTHDLDYKLDYNKNLLFNQIGLYRCENELLNDLKLLKTYGFMNNKIFDALWFWNDFDDNDESNVINLLQDLLIGYYTELSVLGKC